ncbi:MAG: immune inhibitor A [Candidatus Moduliflexus flocculans]|nr:immune inhibitor A [Candidatus Moduliflexus flocculans]
MMLTREFDFTSVSGDITFSFRTWYDLEKDYDYLYFEVSEDGKNWQIITTPSGTAEDPSGNSYGWGYNGATNGWIQEEIDLSQYAGKKVQVRFEYVTDAAVLGEGFLLDDVSVDAISYSTDFETDDGGWQAAGLLACPKHPAANIQACAHHKGFERHHRANDRTRCQSIGGDSALIAGWRRSHSDRVRHDPLYPQKRRLSN